jgi:hypothetical protein
MKIRGWDGSCWQAVRAITRTLFRMKKPWRTYYLAACERLASEGLRNTRFPTSRAGLESRHNLKYWTRQPYFGFGVDAHSMLRLCHPDVEGVRFAPADSLERYVSAASLQRTYCFASGSFGGKFFSRAALDAGQLACGTCCEIRRGAVENARGSIAELVEGGLMEQRGDVACFTSRGRLLSNEVFEQIHTGRRNSLADSSSLENSTPKPGIWQTIRSVGLTGFQGHQSSVITRLAALSISPA